MPVVCADIVAAGYWLLVAVVLLFDVAFASLSVDVVVSVVVVVVVIADAACGHVVCPFASTCTTSISFGARVLVLGVWLGSRRLLWPAAAKGKRNDPYMNGRTGIVAKPANINI